MSIQISLSLFFATLSSKAAFRHIIFRRHTSFRGPYILDTYSLEDGAAKKSLTSLICVVPSCVGMGPVAKLSLKRNKAED